MKYKGMTVNERLYVSGLMDKFDLAVKMKDVKAAKTILDNLELGEENVKAVLKHYGLE